MLHDKLQTGRPAAGGDNRAGDIAHVVDHLPRILPGMRIAGESAGVIFIGHLARLDSARSDYRDAPEVSRLRQAIEPAFETQPIDQEMCIRDSSRLP